MTGRTWGGCIEVVQWVLTAGRFPADPAVLDGGVLLLEASEELIPAREFGWIVRSLGERGLLAAVSAVLVARPPTSDLTVRPDAVSVPRCAPSSATWRSRRCGGTTPRQSWSSGVPFGHTRPQWILPYGGLVTVDGHEQRIWADYS